ncbi:hypothetical protein RFI_20438 [Reticulomyxa filosa]|uniref:25S rRNA (uridine-N(3))-methyltransferase BMT5-like domain-containing protein n=1 Tax=Reticulomyxa filosa TaxID=46433 RepID=X6MSW3_RETFI|nr:hypothetical protein RFI_20438 [Reticulomyxa filosa]|eukprot:ETO16899.1 hypothetical protein RFI_20438 [Reticulomyxa filosa]
MIKQMNVKTKDHINEHELKEIVCTILTRPVGVTSFDEIIKLFWKYFANICICVPLYMYKNLMIFSLYSATVDEYQNLLKIKCAHFSKQSWDEFVSNYAHQSLHCTLALAPHCQNKQSHDQPCNLLCYPFIELTTEQINYFKHLYLQDKDDSSYPTRILVVYELIQRYINDSISQILHDIQLCGNNDLSQSIIIYEIDATNLELTFPVSTQHNLLEEEHKDHAKKEYLEFFDLIIFNFPHLQKKRVEHDNGDHRLKTANQQLIVKFLQSCWKLLKPKQDRIMISLHVSEFK